MGGVAELGSSVAHRALLNIANFSLLLMVLAGAFSGLGAAHAHKAGVPAAILFAFGGLALGILLGLASSKFALDSKRLHAGVGLLVYIAIPLVGLLAVALVPFLVARIVLGHT